MLLTGLEFRTATDPNRLSLLQTYVGTEEEISRMRRSFNGGDPTAEFWSALRPGSSSEPSPTVVTLRQQGGIAPASSLMLPTGTIGAMRVPILARGPQGNPIGGDVTLEVRVRLC